MVSEPSIGSTGTHATVIAKGACWRVPTPISWCHTACWHWEIFIISSPHTKWGCCMCSTRHWNCHSRLYNLPVRPHGQCRDENSQHIRQLNSIEHSPLSPHIIIWYDTYRVGNNGIVAFADMAPGPAPDVTSEGTTAPSTITTNHDPVAFHHQEQNTDEITHDKLHSIRFHIITDQKIINSMLQLPKKENHTLWVNHRSISCLPYRSMPIWSWA